MHNANLILDTDSYKASHWLQFPPNTTGMYSYLESRGGKYTSTVFFGLQYLLKEKLSKPITRENVEEAKAFFTKHGLPFNYSGWLHIVEKHSGFLPIKIKAVAEGTIVPTNNVLMTVESTDSECFWIVSWIETLLMRVWYPITVATQSWHIKQIIKKFLKATSDNWQSEINFKLHDFGSRGVSSSESAAIGGAAHLVNFMGSDTVLGVVLANEIYKHDMAAFSIPAAEHSTVTSWGEENEEACYRNMLAQFAKPNALLAVVSDSYDLFNAVEKIWGEKLKSAVQNSGACVVIRPDSGNPIEVVLQTTKLLADKFGYSYNSKGYKVLNNVRVIQGDGVNEDSIHEILTTLEQNNFSASNIAFGMGGALLQQVNRDTQKFAYKCSEVVVDGKSREVFKNPKTDPGKKSKKGRLDLIKPSGQNYSTVKAGEQDFNSVLRTVFENGKITKEFTLDEIRNNTNIE